MNTHERTGFELVIPTSKIKPPPRRLPRLRTTEDALLLACRLSTQYKRPYYVYGTAYGPTVTDIIGGIMQQYYRIDANVITYYDRIFA